MTASTTNNHLKLGMKIKDFKKYYGEYPIRGKTYDPMSGAGKFMEHLDVIDIRDLTL